MGEVHDMREEGQKIETGRGEFNWLQKEMKMIASQGSKIAIQSIGSITGHLSDGKHASSSFKPGLEITAGQRTMPGLIGELTSQLFVLPVMLTGHNRSY